MTPTDHARITALVDRTIQATVALAVLTLVVLVSYWTVSRGNYEIVRMLAIGSLGFIVGWGMRSAIATSDQRGTQFL